MGKVPATTDVKLIAIGNSRGIRLPKVLLRKYGWSDSLVLREMEEGVFLYGKHEEQAVVVGHLPGHGHGW